MEITDSHTHSTKSSPLEGNRSLRNAFVERIRGGLLQILAALSFFTRLPFWKLMNIDKEYYERVVPLWPLVGYLTGGAMALFAWLTFSLPVYTSVILCLIIRVLITGALHEDGFADFCDGFGGGTSRQRTLEIMKDSHIGTYGVLGLILYFLLQVTTIGSIMSTLDNPLAIAAVIITADVFCKWISSTIIYFLPYARKEEEAKNKLIYKKVKWSEKIISLIIGILPLLIIQLSMFLYPSSFFHFSIPLIIASTASILTAVYLFHLMNRKIQGYTGDCCGATFIITEAVFYLIFLCTC